jgi:hypothetical protein
VAKKTTVGKTNNNAVVKAPTNISKEALWKWHRVPTAHYSPTRISISINNKGKRWVSPKCQVTQRMGLDYSPDKIAEGLKLNVMGDDDLKFTALDQRPDK